MKVAFHLRRKPSAEPASAVLLGVGLLGTVLRLRRRRHGVLEG